MTEIETPFQKIHISHSTLAEVVIWLQRNQSEAAAEECLAEALGDGPIVVEPMTNEIFQSAVDIFTSDTNKDPNFGEYLDYAMMQDTGIKHILTWDSDFCRFNDALTMFPHKMWNV